jgi:hypothetical protein
MIESLGARTSDVQRGNLISQMTETRIKQFMLGIPKLKLPK